MAKEKDEKAVVADKPEATPEETAAKSKKKKMLIFIVGGVVATAGIGGGLAAFLSKSDKPTHTEAAPHSAEPAPAEGKKDEHAKDEHAKEEKKDEHGKEEKKDGHGKEEAKDGKKDDKAEVKLPQGVDLGCNYPFKSFNLNLGNPLENRYIRLELAVEHGCADEDKNELKGREPQLRDAIIGVISKKTREFLLSPDGKAQLTHEIRNQINQRMSRPIKDVYITDILIE